MTFEWDDDKATTNLAVHKVSFEQAKRVFDDPMALPFEDEAHSSANEARYVMIGMCAIGLVFVSFTYRGSTIRLISARRASRRMQRLYNGEEE